MFVCMCVRFVDCYSGMSVCVCVRTVCVSVCMCVCVLCVVNRKQNKKRRLGWAYESTNLVLGRDPDPGSLTLILTEMWWVQQRQPQCLWH